MSLRILSLNVRGLQNNKKRRAIFNYCRNRADISILQETHSLPKNEQVWQTEWGSRIWFSHGSSNAKGVCILKDKNCSADIKKLGADTDGRVIWISVSVELFNFVIVGIYAPNKDCPEFYRNIKNILSTVQHNKMVIGDYNLVLNEDLDRLCTNETNVKAQTEVYSMMEEFLLNDIWRSRNTLERRYSWIKNFQNENTKASRIAIALISSGLTSLVENITYAPGVMTDHASIIMAVKTSLNPRGRGYWKMNISLLEHPKNIDILKQSIIKEINSNEDPIKRWEAIKCAVKKKAQELSRTCNKERKLIISQLYENIDDLESRLPLTLQENELLIKSKSDLNDMVWEETKGVMFRAKAKWHEEGERSTKYFYSLEKSRFLARTCQTLLWEEEEITENAQILSCLKTFYMQLYTEDKSVQFTLENNTNIKISQDLKTKHEVEFSDYEIKQSVWKLNTGKTPGKGRAARGVLQNILGCISPAIR